MGWIRSALGRLAARPSLAELPRSRLRALESRLGYRFRDPRLLVQALKHRSWVYANQGDGVDSNERLEYLGDAVLDLAVAESLFGRYEDRREGDLTQMKSLVVSRALLARRARSIDLGRHILLSPEERAAGGDEQDLDPQRRLRGRHRRPLSRRRAAAGAPVHRGPSSSTTSRAWCGERTSSISRACSWSTCRAAAKGIPSTRC